jgi:hypothetical protein
MVLKKPLVTLALAGGAFGLSMGISYAVASAATGGSTNTNVPSTTVSTSSTSPSTSTPSTTTPNHPCPNMGGSQAPTGAGSGGPAAG